MKPAPFELLRPERLDEALAMLGSADGDTRLLAGGQSLVPAMNFRLARPSSLIDLNRVSGLDGIAATADGGLRIGAMTRQRAVERSPLAAERAPLLVESLAHVAHVAVRNRGTVGGSVANADPAAEIPAVALALGATYVLAGRDGERRVTAESFHVGLFETALREGEMLVAVELPPPRGSTAFEELARRPGDFALAGAAVRVERDGVGACRDVRIALLGVGESALLAASAMASLRGTVPDPVRIAEAARVAANDDVAPEDDLHASARYRRRLVRVMVERALGRALDRAA